ncbi:MAG: hypothetical protein Q7S10_00575 [bacterium]|nr:hypothetical protein [bacterium]
MINLLPPKEKQALVSQQNKKLVIVMGNVVLISLCSLALVLLSVKFYILGELTYHKFILSATEKKYETPDFLFFKGLIQDYNISLTRMHNFYKNEMPVSDVIKAILEVPKPEGLHLTDIKIEKGAKGNKITATISGISDNRDSLALFKSGIESNIHMKNVYFPPNNWIKPSDLPFYLTFEYDASKYENSK